MSAFMIPVAVYFDANDLAEINKGADEDERLEGPGFYARLTAPGYLDCTDWCGPFPSVFRALRDLCSTYEVDLEGNPRKEGP
jgi:hypothetical protein